MILADKIEHINAGTTILGMIQAATSINEATLSFVPKLIVVALCLAIFGGAIIMLLVDFTQDIYARIPEITR